jgi:hypothetical protein
MESDTTHNWFVDEMNASVWAKEFVKQVKLTPGIVEDEFTMVTWFANAITVGYSKGYEKAMKDWYGK